VGTQGFPSAVTIGPVRIGPGEPMCLIAGPCVLENERIVLQVAEVLARISAERRLPVIFKSSYEKDNRSGPDGYRGPGIETGLLLLERVRRESGLPILSDVHRESDVAAAAGVLDVVQIPAFLCQQTSLLLEVGHYARTVNLKKGQFLAPEDMGGPVAKIKAAGCRQVLLTERGTCFGYHRLVADLTAIQVMQSIGCPVAFDATHIVRRYGVSSHDPAGGDPTMVPLLARAAVAAGCDALFLEIHPEPRTALCDASSMLPLEMLPRLLDEVLAISAIVRSGQGGRS
jgi:2-dehydro-3-deoxyphosphooctonate aldolase (KDO 8-P synthase)